MTVARRARSSADAAAPGSRPSDAPTLPTSIERIDLTVDHAAVIVRGDGRAVAVALTEG
jgi:hypothetical protein